MIDPALIPKKPQHQRFADRLLAGDAPADAYLAAGYKAASRKVAIRCAQRLAKTKGIQAYMRAVQAEAAQGAVASVRYKRELLFEIMDTPLMDIDPKHPTKKHGRLIKKYKSSELGIEIEKICPLKAMEIDNKLSGDDPEQNNMRALADAIASLASSTAIPTGKM